MTDFASALMVRVLADGMRRLGLTPPPGLEPGAGAGARLALDDKRTVVQAALAQGGLGALARLGAGVQRMRHEPMHQALVAAAGAADLFARWQRFERYVHSRHRIVVERVDEAPDRGRAVLRHTARTGTPPLAAEDLVVLGVLAALLAEAGAQAVTARAGDAVVLPQDDAAALAAAAQAGRTDRWTLDWRGTVAPRPAGPATADALPSAVADGLRDDARWPPVACDAARRLAADLARARPVAELAEAMGLATRTLQRRLAEAGLSYSTVLGEARCRAASWWLIRADTALAEVGFLCGYADQSHFTRDFGHRIGLPPAAFRAAFGTAGRA